MEFDVFISHASEDKDAIAKPLAGHLRGLGYCVWYDGFTLALGDSLRQSIDRGLARSRFGVVILSPNFFAKRWTRYELDGLTTREMSDGQKVILPVWHQVTRDEVAQYSPTLADRVAAVTTLPLPDLAEQVASVLGPPLLPGKPFNPFPHAAWLNESCPRCGQEGQTVGYEGSDGDEAAWFECPHCGFWEFIQ
jgi:hypothetical protein